MKHRLNKVEFEGQRDVITKLERIDFMLSNSRVSAPDLTLSAFRAVEAHLRSFSRREEKKVSYFILHMTS